MFLRCKLYLQFARNFPSKLIFDCDAVVTKFLFVIVGPELLVCVGVDQLGVNGNVISETHDSAFNDRIHLQVACNLPQRFFRVLIRHS
jgi:hypothetical protein